MHLSQQFKLEEVIFLLTVYPIRVVELSTSAPLTVRNSLPSISHTIFADRMKLHQISHISLTFETNRHPDC